MQIADRCLGYYAPQGKLYDYDCAYGRNKETREQPDELPALTPKAGDEITIDNHSDLEAVLAILAPLGLKLVKQEGFITFYSIVARRTIHGEAND